MPKNEQITIHPKDLQEIMDTLSAIPWNTGPVTIKDDGHQFIVRDINEAHITSIDKTLDKDG